MLSNIATVSRNKAINMCVSWKSATSFMNFYRNDPFMDLMYKRHPRTLGDFVVPSKKRVFRFSTLKKVGKTPKKIDRDPAFDYVCSLGYDFEKQTLNRVRSLYDSRLELSGPGMNMNRKYALTYKAIKKGNVDIIIHGVVRNYTNQTYGCPDLIVKGKTLYRLGVHTPVQPDTYYAVDIKASTIDLRAGGGIVNTYSVLGYKSQIMIYTHALNEMQDNTSDSVGFVLGKKYKFLSGNTYESHQMLATVDFKTYDSNIVEYLQDAINWLNWVDLNGDNPDAVYPEEEMMYPNMKNTYNGPYTKIKEQYAEHIDELTRMWNIGVKERSIAFKHKIRRLSDMKDVTNVGICPKSKTGNILQKMIDTTHSDQILSIPSQNNVLGWRNRTDEEWFLDVETVDNIVYMIGVKTPERYTCLVADGLYSDYEKGILTELIMMMEKRNPVVWTWSGYDQRVLLDRMKTHNMVMPPSVWKDMCHVFKNHENPIGVKGALGYGLKDISKALSYYDYIPNHYEDLKCMNGLESIIQAKKAYNENDWETMENIIKYNKADCLSLHDILQSIRSN